MSRICMVYPLRYFKGSSISDTISADVGTLRTKVEIHMPPLQLDLSLGSVLRRVLD